LQKTFACFVKSACVAVFLGLKWDYYFSAKKYENCIDLRGAVSGKGDFIKLRKERDGSFGRRQCGNCADLF